MKRPVLQQSYIGAIYTRRDAPDDAIDASHTLGIDVRLATARFLGSQNLEATGWMLHANRPGVRSGNNAFGALIAYPNDRWDVRADLREVQQNFDPAVGFVTRRNYRRYQPSLTLGPRPRGHRYIRRFLLGPTVDIQTDLDNALIVRTLGITMLDTQLHSQDSFAFGNDVHARAARCAIPHQPRHHAAARG